MESTEPTASTSTHYPDTHRTMPKSSLASLLCGEPVVTSQVRIRARYVAKNLFIDCTVPDSVTVGRTRDLLLLRCDLWTPPVPQAKLPSLRNQRSIARLIKSSQRKSLDDDEIDTGRNSMEEDEERDRCDMKWRSGFGLFYPAAGHWLDDARPLSYYGLKDMVFLELHHRSDFVSIPPSMYHLPYAHGYLLKKTKSFTSPSGWKRRWFVLRGSTLYQYIHRTDTEPESSLELASNYTLVWRPEDNHHPNIIRLEKRNSVVALTAEDERELRHWYRVMSDVIDSMGRRSRSMETLNYRYSMEQNTRCEDNGLPILMPHVSDIQRRIPTTGLRQIDRPVSKRGPRWSHRLRHVASMLSMRHCASSQQNSDDELDVMSNGVSRHSISSRSNASSMTVHNNTYAMDMFSQKPWLNEERGHRPVPRISSNQSLRHHLLRSRAATDQFGSDALSRNSTPPLSRSAVISTCL